MLKQSSIRSSRSKGYRGRSVLQICLVLVLCVWLIIRLRHYNEKVAGYENVSGKMLENVDGEFDVLKFGRKDLSDLQVDLAKADLDTEIGDKAETGVDLDEIKAGDVDEEIRGGGDDEIDSHDLETQEEEEAEEVEDLIDVDDRGREEGNEYQEDEDKGEEVDDVDSLEDQAKAEGEKQVREAREKHYTDDDASSSVVLKSGAQLGAGAMRRLKESVIDTLQQARSGQ